jgi:hypothetical protein
MLVVYGVGFAAVFAIFALLYLHAYRRRGALALNELERHDTLSSFQENGLMSLVGVLSLAIVFGGGPRYTALAGMCYWLIAPVLFLHGHLRGRRRKRLEQNLPDAEPAPLNATADV